MVWGQAGFFSAPPLARNSRSPRARLAFASVRLKYAKNHACSAGYKSGGVGHDSQSVPGEIFARAHFHPIAEGRQTCPRVESGVEIMLEVRSLSMVKEFSNDTSLLNISQADSEQL